MKTNIIIYLMLMIFILLWIMSCDYQKNSIKKEFVFQGKYDSLNKAKVINNINEDYIGSLRKEFESNSEIKKFEIFDFKTEEVDTGVVLTSIKLIIENQNFLFSNVIPDSIKSCYLAKALKVV